MGKNYSGGCTVGAGCTEWLGLSRFQQIPKEDIIIIEDR